VASKGPVFAGMLLAFGLSIGGVLVIVDALRRIFVTLTAGDPFHPNNVRRLRLVGVMLAALEISRYVVWGLSPLMPLIKRNEPEFQPHLLVLRPGGLRARRGVPRGREAAARSRADDLGAAPRHADPRPTRPRAARTAACR
jgi:hypothetical protein